MKRILVIEDDPPVAEIYRETLRLEGFAVDLATDGAAGLEAFRRCKPDLVLLDLMLPRINGVEVLKAIRAQFNPQSLPVLVITNAYLSTTAEEACEAGANHVLEKTAVRPSTLRKAIEDVLVKSRPPEVSEPPANAAPELPIRERFLKTAPERLAALWRPLRALAAEPRNRSHLQDLLAQVRPLNTAASLAGLDVMAQLASALEALLKDLCSKPRHLDPPVLLTIAQAMDTFKFLLDHPSSGTRKSPWLGRVLVVDDDEFTRRAVSRALSKVNLRATCVPHPVSALKRRVGSQFDLILLDVEMPEVTGFDLCTRFRATPAHHKTPIIFLSIHAGLEYRTESVLRGGNDYVAKPVLHPELAVKALCFIIRGPGDPTEADCGSNGRGTESAFSRRELSLLKQRILSSFPDG